MRRPSTRLLIERTEYFSVEHAHCCNVPGYLIIEPVPPTPNIWLLSEQAQQELGQLQARCARAIQEVVQPLRIYCLTFAEEVVNYHCHLFPRSVEGTSLYLKDFPEQAQLIRGPLFFDWARERYHEDVVGNSAILKVVDRIRSLISKPTRPSSRPML